MSNIKFKSINQDQVLRLHSEGNCLKDITVKLSTTEYIVNKILKLNGLHAIKNGSKIDRLKEKYQDIINSYQKTNKLSLVAREFNISENLVNRVLKRHNVQKRKVDKNNFMGLNQQEVIKEYEKVYKVKPISDKFGVSNTVILKLLHFNNVRVSRIKYSDEQIIEKFNELKSIESTCRDLSLKNTVVRNILNKHNIERPKLSFISIGDIFRKLKVIDVVHKIGDKRRNFLLLCECGEQVIRNSSRLVSGKSWHCGCVVTQRKMKKEERERIRKEEYQNKLIKRVEKKREKDANRKPKKTYKVGDVKERLTIISIIGDKYYERIFTTKCECGNITEIKMRNFYQKKSCGCLVNEKRRGASITHGQTIKYNPERRRWYDRWKSMVRRCHNPKSHGYNNYGGRGIQVCDRWLEPNGVGGENYYNDIHNILGPQPSPEHSLDRIDNDGMYEISNMRWATISEQNKNQRRRSNKK